MSERSRVTIEAIDTRMPTGECPNCKLNVAFNHVSRRDVWPTLKDRPFGAARSSADFNGASTSAEPRPKDDVFCVVEHILSCQNCRKTAVDHGKDCAQVTAVRADNTGVNGAYGVFIQSARLADNDGFWLRVTF